MVPNPNSPDVSEDELPADAAERLVAYEAAKFGGTPAPNGDANASASPVQLSDNLACVDLLHRVWPDLNGTSQNAGQCLPLKELGDFRIVREIGSGGMGTVYEAVQQSMGRRVALKVLPFAALVQERSLQRFRNEVRAAAALDHPHIVAVYSIGEERGVHFYAMQLVRGQTLADLISQLRTERKGIAGVAAENAADDALPNRARTIASTVAPLPATKRDNPARVSTEANSRRAAADFYLFAARLGVQAAGALQHAHDQGVLHRDVKPSNLLLDADGKLYVTDFGLARIQAEDGMTRTGDVVGTLRYMAPEQALAKRVVIDHRADVYSLGATLYELLTLEPAFGESDRVELLKQIAFEEPRSPRKHDRRIPVDLETIVRKAMDKNPDDRYETAQRLAEDLQRFLTSQPIKARPASVGDRAWKWSRRHHMLVATAGLLAVLLAAVLAVGVIITERSRARVKVALDQTSQHRERLADTLYAADVRLASQAWKENDLPRAMELLQHHIPAKGDVDRRDLEWYFLRKLCTSKFVPFASINSAVYDFAISPDGTQLAAVGKDATLRVYDLGSRQLLAQINTSQTEVNGVTYFPDGQTIATVGDDGTARIWHKLNPEAQKIIHAHDGIAYDIVYSKALNCLITCGEDSKIKMWNPITGDLLGSLSRHTKSVTTLAVSRSGKHLASASRDETVRIWNLKTRRELHKFERARGVSLAFDHQDKRLMIGTVSNFVEHNYAIRLDTFQLEAVPVRAKQSDSVAVSPSGRFLVAAIDSGVMWVWELRANTEDFSNKNLAWSAHEGQIYQLAFTPDGQHVISAGEDGNIRIWDNPEKRIESGALEVLGGVRDVAPVGQQPLLAVAGTQGVAIVHVPTGKLVEQLAEGRDFGPVAVSANGKLVAAGESNNKISVWQLDSPAPRSARTYQIELGTNLVFSPDGSTLATFRRGYDDGLVLIDLETNEKRSGFVSHGCNGFAWSPDGRFHTAAENHSDAILVHDSATGQLIHRFEYHHTTITGLAISPNSLYIASADDNRQVCLWDVERGKMFWSATTSASAGVRGLPTSITFSPSGRTLWILNHKGMITALQVATGRELLQFDDFVAGASRMAFCAGGEFLCSEFGRQLRIIDTGYQPERIPSSSQ